MSEHDNPTIGSKRLFLLRIFLVVVSATAFTLVLELAGWARGFELAALDSWTRARLHLKLTPQSRDIAIVSIGDQDYADIFGEKSPLNEKGVQEILKAIASAQPSVIGVDLDTSAPHFQEMEVPVGIPIVWAEDYLFNDHKPEEIRILHALGGKSEERMTGIASVPMESDGMVRSYSRKLGRYDSFTWALVQAYCAQLSKSAGHQTAEADTLKRCKAMTNPNHNEADEDLMLNLVGGRAKFPHLSAREVLDDYQRGGQNIQKQIKGRIVLLGGTFRAGRDEYATPVGRLAGVELMSHAVETDLHGGGFRRPSEVVTLVLNLLGGILILLMFIQFRLLKGSLLAVLMILIVSPLWSRIAFGSVGYAPYFIVILGALFIHQLYEQVLYRQHWWLHHLRRDKPTVTVAVETHEPPPETEQSGT